MEEIEVYPDLFMNGKSYKATKEVGTLNCSGCVFDSNKADCVNACDEAVSIVDCSKYGIVWVNKESEVTLPEPLATDKQEGGFHYKTAIQPIEYIHANKLDFFEGNVVKYVTRHRSKNKAEDIKKAIHYLELILQLDYNQGN